ncbi:MAG TPA: hypothetical protein VH482_25385 [Thermomicrobiales bacterium]|jgi:hypothetical protein
MERGYWRAWVRPYGLPVLFLLGSLGFMFVFWDDPDMVWALFVAPALAFLSGLVLRPAHAWVAPAAVAGLVFAASVAADALGLIEPEFSGLKFALAILVVLVLAVAAPQAFCTWAGREIASGTLSLLRRHRGPDATAA